MMRVDCDVKESVLAFLASNSGIQSIMNGVSVIDRRDVSDLATFMTVGLTPVYDWTSYVPLENEHDMTIHIWSRSGTKDEINKINASLTSTLGNAILSPSGGRLINLEFQYSGAGWDPEEARLHGLLRYRIREMAII